MKTLEARLSPEQLEIAQAACDRNLLVVAGPGSGKTHLLTHVAAHQVRQSPGASWRVLCITFGKEAAKEMRSRLHKPDVGVPQPWRLVVENFHGFASEILGRYGHLQGWPRDAQVFDDSEAQEVAGEVVADLGIRNLSAKDAYAGIKHLRLRRPDTTTRLPADKLLDLNRAYERRMTDLRVRDYDQLILHAIDLLDAHPRVAQIVRASYRFLVVDELQDTSGFQLEFIARISGEGTTRTFAVADNDQMIYGWRDARAENIAEWQRRFGAEIRPLQGTYRCPPDVVAAANSLIAHNRPTDGGTAYSLRTDRQGQVLVARANGNEQAEADLVGAIVQGELDRGMEPQEIAILAPNRSLFDKIAASLDGRGIECVRVGDDPAAGRPFARVLRTALALAVAPANPRGRTRLAKLLDLAHDSEAAETAIDDLLEASSLSSMAERVRVRLGLSEDNNDVVHGRQVLSLAQREWGGDPPSVIGRRIALEWHRLSVQLQRGTTAVKMMTTFAAKGLEFRSVILPDFGTVPAWKVMTPTELEEERRKLYVEITRSSDRVIITYRPTNPSRFLSELDQTLLRNYA
jgi:DNA helicase-2/ATP-dependent DNA helicase PcrA